jgi:arabinofuranosyltransferase
MGIDSIYFTSLAFSFLHLGLFIYLARRIANSPIVLAFGLITMFLHGPIVDYFTSGLENSLNFLLVAALVYYLAQNNTNKAYIVMGLLLVSRLDLVVLVLPLLIYSLYHSPDFKAKWWCLVRVGGPVGAWLVFALVYYGSYLPNSMIAKSAFRPGIISILHHDWSYLMGSQYFHPWTFILPTVLSLGFMAKWRVLEYWEKGLTLGALAYLIFPFGLGGDFMAGRFQTVPTVLLILLVTRRIGSISTWIPLQLCMILIWLVHSNSILNQWKELAWLGLKETKGYNVTMDEITWVKKKFFLSIAEEKLFYLSSTNLTIKLAFILKRGIIQHFDLYYWGAREVGLRYRVTNQEKVVKKTMAGVPPYYGGPKMYLTDNVGIVDPLIARLPKKPSDNWRVGHVRRVYPVGYLESLRGDNNQIEDPQVAALYHDLRLAHRSPELFERERWEAIWRLNTGYHHIPYDYR